MEEGAANVVYVGKIEDLVARRHLRFCIGFEAVKQDA
jgi:hypothetical protein